METDIKESDINYGHLAQQKNVPNKIIQIGKSLSPASKIPLNNNIKKSEATTDTTPTMPNNINNNNTKMNNTTITNNKLTELPAKDNFHQHQQQQQHHHHQQQQQQQKPNNQQTNSVEKCVGCMNPITEKYLLKVMNQSWHEDCLKCSCCNCRLGEVGSTLFTRANLMLCKRDYLRLFGTTGYCSSCSKPIPAFEMVMKARGNVYHLDCFSCHQCNHRFCVGDRYYLHDNKILCEIDYEEKISFSRLKSNNNDNNRPSVDQTYSTATSTQNFNNNLNLSINNNIELGGNSDVNSVANLKHSSTAFYQQQSHHTFNQQSSLQHNYQHHQQQHYSQYQQHFMQPQQQQRQPN